MASKLVWLLFLLQIPQETFQFLTLSGHLKPNLDTFWTYFGQINVSLNNPIFCDIRTTVLFFRIRNVKKIVISRYSVQIFIVIILY